MCLTTLQHFHLVTLFYMTATMTFLSVKPLLICYPRNPLGCTSVEAGFAELLLVPSRLLMTRKVTILAFEMVLT